jgi:hypothetical protein
MAEIKHQFRVFDQTQKQLFLLTIILFTISLIIKVGFITSTVPNIRGVEPSVLFSVQEIMAGDPLYPDPEEPPFPSTQYMPLYYILVANISKLFNIIPGEQYLGLYLVGRTLSVVFSLGISITVYLSCRKVGADFFMSFLGAVTSFILPIPWFSLLRPDALAALFGISAMVVYSLHLKEQDLAQHLVKLIAVGALGFLSLLSKQNGAIFLVAIGVYPALRFRLREIACIFFGIILAFVVSSLIFSTYYSMIPTESNHFYTHIIGGLNNGVDLHLAYTKLYSLWLSWYFPLAAIPLGGIIILVKSIREQGYKEIDEVVLFLALSFILVTSANLMAGIKYGSAIHYMNESMIIAVLFLIRLFTIRNTYALINRNTDIKTLFSSYLFLFILVLLAHQTFLYRDVLRRSRIIDRRAPLSRIEISNFFEDELLAHPDALIYTDVFLIKNLFFDHIIFPQEDLAQLHYSREILTYSKLSDLVEDGTLRYLVTRENFDPPSELYGSKLDGFELYDSTSTFDIYINTQAP